MDLNPPSDSFFGKWGTLISTLNIRILIIRTPKKVPLIFAKDLAPELSVEPEPGFPSRLC